MKRAKRIDAQERARDAHRRSGVNPASSRTRTSDLEPAS
jgi:hypothetical protein